MNTAFLFTDKTKRGKLGVVTDQRHEPQPYLYIMDSPLEKIAGMEILSPNYTETNAFAALYWFSKIRR